LGPRVERTVAEAEVGPGEPIKMHPAAVVRSTVPVRLLAIRLPGSGREAGGATALSVNQPMAWDTTWTLPADTPLSQPYWLREEGTVGMFRVDDPKLIGRPENPPAVPVEWAFEVGGQTLVITDEPVQV